MNEPFCGSTYAARVLAGRVRHFVGHDIVPHEPVLAGGGARAAALLAGLSARARRAGLWGMYYPAELGGRVASLRDYLLVAEQEGASEYGPAIFGSDVALDVHMLHRHGHAELRQRVLEPLAAGRVVCAYGMSEPDSAGSVPATLRTCARREQDQWRIDGRKWFVCRGGNADFVTVVARTRDGGPVGQSLSLLLVPATSAGYRIEREQPVFGRLQGQCELVLEAVRVPDAHLLGQAHSGHVLIRERLLLDRVLHAGHWLGLAERCYGLMCRRIASARGRLVRLADKQLTRLKVFECYSAIVSARALLVLAAGRLDRGLVADIDVNVAKVAASRAVSLVSDAAIQIYGAEGVSDQTPLSGIYRTARATHIMDGADEALISAVGKRLLETFADDGQMDFSRTGPDLTPLPAGG